MRTSRLITALFLAGFLASCGGAAGGADPEASVFEVKKGDLKVTLTESGTLRARSRVDIRPSIKTSAKILTLVEEGKIVATGDVLVELDKAEVEKDIERLEDMVIQLETELKNAKTEVQIQKQENESEAEKGALKLDFAKLELEKYEEGTRPQEIRDLDLRIERAASRRKQAADDWDKMPELNKAGFVTDVELEEKRLKLREAGDEVTSAELAKQLYQEYSLPMTRRQKQSDVTEADRELGRSAARAEARLDSKIAVERQKQRQYEAAVLKLTEQKAELENLTICAPQPGIVIYSGSRDRYGNMDDSIKVGGTAFPGRTLIELPDLTKMDVELQVHQADIGKIRIGQTAFVSIAGRRGGALRARLTEIGSVAQSRNWRDPVKRFDIVVQLVDDVEGLRAGVTAEVEIDVGELTDVVYIPLQSVAASAGAYYAHVAENGEATKRRVTLGRSNDQYVEVLSGLSPGEMVLLVNPEIVSGESKGSKPEEAATPAEQPKPETPARGGGSGTRSPGGRGSGAPGGGGGR